MRTLTNYNQAVLAKIAESPSSTIDDLAAQFNTSRSGISNVLKRLRQNGHTIRLPRKARVAKGAIQKKVVEMLIANPGIQAKQLASKLSIAPGSATRTINELKASGFIITNGYTIVGMKDSGSHGVNFKPSPL